MANTSLDKKLKIKLGQHIRVINSPDGFLDELGSLLEGVDLSNEFDGQRDFILLFVSNSKQLEENLPAALDSLKEDGLFWLSYPKKSSKIETDLSRDQGWDALTKAGLRPVSLVSINDTWSAFRVRKGTSSSSQATVEAQYSGAKADLRPIYDRLVEVAQAFGSDVELAPRKSYVGLVRKKIFGVVKASTRTRVDLGLKLKEAVGSKRLVDAPGFGSGSISHKIALTSLADVDEELIGWMREAYDSVG